MIPKSDMISEQIIIIVLVQEGMAGAIGAQIPGVACSLFDFECLGLAERALHEKVI
jgi:hypothetical protein